MFSSRKEKPSLNDPRRISPLTDALSDPWLMLDRSGTLVGINPVALDLLDLDGGWQDQGVEFEDLLAPGQEESFQIFLASISAERGSAEKVYDLFYKDGTVRSTKVIAARVQEENSSRILYSCILKPITPSPDSGFTSWSGNLESGDLQWLSEQARLLMWIHQRQEIYQFAGRALQQQIGDCIVLSLSISEEDALVLEGIFGIDEQELPRVWKLLGDNQIGKSFQRDPRFREEYSQRRLSLHSAGFDDFATSHLPKALSRKVAEMLGIHQVYTIGLEGNQRTMGNFHIFTLTPEVRVNPELVEVFSYQVALALERAQFADDLNDTEERFRVLFEHAPDGYYISDLKGNIIDGNRAAEEITGYAREELIGKNYLEIGLLPESQIPRVMKLLARNLAGKSTGPDEILLERKDGRVTPVEIRTHPVSIDSKNFVLGIARDISKRKETAQKLDQTQKTLTRVLDSIDAHIYAADLETHEILYMNDRMIEDFGGDFTGRTCYEAFRGETQPCENCNKEALLARDGQPEGIVVWEGLNRITNRWYVNYDRVIHWTDQRLVRFQIAIDITEGKEAASALEQSEERYRRLFESAKDALMTLHPPDWEFSSCNPALLDLFLLESEEVFLGLKPWELSPEHQPDGRGSQQKALEMIQIALDQGSHSFGWRHKRLDGEVFPATVQLIRVDAENGSFLQATILDITEQVRAEKIMQQQMDDLALINSLNVAANDGKSLREILAIFQEQARKVFDCNHLLLGLLSEDQQSLEIDLAGYDQKILEQIESSLPTRLPEQIDLPLREGGVFWQFLREGDPRILSNPAEISKMLREFSALPFIPTLQVFNKLLPLIKKLFKIESMLYVPLAVRGKTIGLLSVSGERVFPENAKDRFVTIAGQISGLIERARTKEQRQHNLKELQLINETFVEGTRLEDIDAMCQLIAEKIHQANPESYLMISLYDPLVQAIRVRSIVGLEGLFGKLTRLLGMDPRDLTINVQDHRLDPDLETQFVAGRLTPVPNGLYDLTRGTVPRGVCRTIERALGIDQAYLAGLSLGGWSTGGIAIFLKKGVKLRFPSAIETIASHFAAIFERRQIQQEIQERTAQLEALRDVELDIIRELNVDDLLISIASKAAMMVEASDSGFSLYNPEKDLLEFQAYYGSGDVPQDSTMKRGEGLAGKVWEGKQTIVIDHYASWEGRDEDWAEVSGDYSVVGIPVTWGDKFLGVLEIGLEGEREFTQREIDSLELFANQAAIAIQNARLFTAEKRRRQEAETLREVGMIINSMMDQSQVLNSILDQLQRVLPFNRASIQLIDGEDLVVKAVAGQVEPQQFLGQKSPIAEAGLLERIIQVGEVKVLSDRDPEDEELDPSDDPPVRSWIGVPLEIRDQRIGVLTVDHHKADRYSGRDAQLVLNFANQAAIALENHRLYHEAQRRMSRIESFLEIDRAISGSLDLQTTMEVLISQLLHSLNVDAAAVLLFDANLQSLNYFSGKGFRTDFLKYTTLELGKGLAGRAALERQMIQIPDLTAQETSLHQSHLLDQEGFITYLAVPLIAKGEIVGVLEVFHRSLLEPNAEWLSYLEALAGQAAIAIDRLNLFNEIERSNVELIQAYDATIEGWAKAIELRDSDTEGHSRRVVQLTLQLARRMGIRGADLAHIRRGALLHDIGKMAIPDRILSKPGELSPEEWKIMQEHPLLAYQMLSSIEYLRPALDIPYYHHERWDGSGYPRGLKGKEIPLAARVFAVVDVWDALQSDRPYREAWSQDQALAYISDEAGGHFDPEVVAAFLQMMEAHS